MTLAVHVEFHDSSVPLPTASVLFFLFLSFFLHPFSLLEDVLKYFIQGWGLECTLSHTFFVPKPFTHSIKDNFPHTNVFICEMAFKAGVDSRRQSVTGQVHLWRSSVPFSQLAPLLCTGRACSPATSLSCNASGVGRAATCHFEEESEGLGASGGAVEGKAWVGVHH